MSDVHVHLSVGAERYALPVEDVRSIVDMEGIAPVLGAPASVLGLRALDGALLPVFDLAALLGVTGAAPRRIVVAAGEADVGLAVDAVLDVAELSQLDDAPGSEHVRGTVLLDGVLVGVIDLGSLLGGLEAELAA